MTQHTAYIMYLIAFRQTFLSLVTQSNFRTKSQLFIIATVNDFTDSKN